MKRIYYLLVVVLICLGNSLNAQDGDLVVVDDGRGINHISLEKYKSISINSIKRTDIEATSGNIDQMRNLFGSDLISSTGTSPNLSIDFKNAAKGIYFSFEDTSDTGNDYELTYYTVFNDQTSVSINDVTFKVGDNISVLGDVRINEQKSVIIFNSSNETSSVIIKFDKFTNVITSITYEVFT